LIPGGGAAMLHGRYGYASFPLCFLPILSRRPARLAARFDRSGADGPGFSERSQIETQRSYRPRRCLMIRSFFGKEAGQGGGDYAAKLAAIAIVVIIVLAILGQCTAEKPSQTGG
jgi:hypothetical protein